ncbi:MAG: class I SAM-dependent methyltransferase [Candidatus Gastranaerophilales bacterium]|nr:class I SAM-dependent methyltransferase [Candidatus Gastranaerophilales bacterium]
MNIIEDKLKELEATQKQFWNIDRGTANFLNILIKTAKLKHIVEVGTSNGYSGLWLALAAKEIGGKVITIEFHKCRYDVAVVNFKLCGLSDYIEARQGMAIDELIDLKKEDYNSEDEQFLDFAFVDANKAQYIKYLEIIDAKLRRGGIIAFDNMISHKEKVQDTLEKLQNDTNYQIQMLNTEAGLLLAYKL